MIQKSMFLSVLRSMGRDVERDWSHTLGECIAVSCSVADQGRSVRITMVKGNVALYFAPKQLASLGWGKYRNDELLSD